MKHHMENCQDVPTKQKPKSKPKKRGRKPHGGIVISGDVGVPKTALIPNMVVHLKCKMSDIQNDISQIVPTTYDPEVNQIVGYSEASLGYEELEQESVSNDTISAQEEISRDTNPPVNNLSRISGRSQLCFFCGCGDRPTPVSIPISPTETVGKFCRPECAAGFLMNHTPNVSIRHDRYQRLNTMYGTPDEQIRVAPEPYTLLNHYDGDMSPNEYHDMMGVCDVIKTNRLIRIIPRVVNETDTASNQSKRTTDTPKAHKYQVRTVSNFFRKPTPTT